MPVGATTSARVARARTKVARAGRRDEESSVCGDLAQLLPVEPQAQDALGAGIDDSPALVDAGAVPTTIEHIAFGYDNGSFQTGVEQASRQRRAEVLAAAQCGHFGVVRVPTGLAPHGGGRPHPS